jgi:hypothetical protein
MRLNIAPAPQTYDTSYINRSFSRIDSVLSFSVSRMEAVDSILLQSPDGSVYKLSVDDAGNLTTTAVALGQQGAPPY